MNTFIEQNKQLLKIYCIVARILGWALLLLPVILVICALLSGIGRFGAFLSWLPPHIEKCFWHRPVFPIADRQIDLLSLVIRFVLPGLLMLGLAQFIKYLSEKDYRPSWLLRCGEGILYLYAVLLTGQAVWNYVLGHSLQAEIYHIGLLVILAPALITAAKVVILIGLGQILARVTPVIEESKTLV